MEKLKAIIEALRGLDGDTKKAIIIWALNLGLFLLFYFMRENHLGRLL